MVVLAGGVVSYERGTPVWCVTATKKGPGVGSYSQAFIGISVCEPSSESACGSDAVNCTPPRLFLSFRHFLSRQTWTTPQFSIQERQLRKIVKRFRGGFVFKDHRLSYHSTLGLRAIKKKKKKTASPTPRQNPHTQHGPANSHSRKGAYQLTSHSVDCITHASSVPAQTNLTECII